LGWRRDAEKETGAMNSPLGDMLFEQGAKLNRVAEKAYERDLDPPDGLGDLTDAEVNAVQRIVEMRAEDEMLEARDNFRDWVSSNKRVLQDWQQYRVAMLSEDEQREILETL
jgi:hypothetical protein